MSAATLPLALSKGNSNQGMLVSMYKNELQSTAGERLGDLGYRKLWCNVIKHAVARAQGTGEGPSIAFFRSEHFELLCFYLQLDAKSIREKVLSTGFSTLNSKRVYKNAGGRKPNANN